MSNKVYIILVNWNGWRDTVECLESVFRSTYAQYRVIVCDNESTDGSLEHIKSWAEKYFRQPGTADCFPDFAGAGGKRHPFREYTRIEAERGGAVEDESYQLILVRTGGNLGFAGGNNIGLRYALARDDFSYVWLLNNDTIVDACALSNLLRRMRSSLQCGICGSTVVYFDDPHHIQARGGAKYNVWTGTTTLIGHMEPLGTNVSEVEIEKAMDCVLGASMLVSAAFLRDVGLMSEDYFLYYEEVDWGIRARGRYRLAYCADSIVYHKEGASIGSGSRAGSQTKLATYYNARNRLKITAKYHPKALPTVYLGLIWSMLGRLLRGQPENALIILRILLGIPCSRAMLT